MKNFLILHYGFEKPSPEDMGAWNAWFESIADKQVDRGGFPGGRELSTSGTRELPFGKDSITGYTLVEAENLDEAEGIAQKCPIVASTRIYEIRKWSDPLTANATGENMAALRGLLVIIFMTIAVYTSVVVANHGLGLFPVFFGDMAEVAWPGQFNLDFMGFLTLSAVWLAWRHHFSPLGIGLGVVGFFGGAPVLTAYLFAVSFSVDGDVKALLLGSDRANATE